MAEIAGLKLIVPSSVSAGTGTATVSASGKVTFSSADDISINDVFSSTYDNYLMVMRLTQALQDRLLVRLRVSGSDASSTNYVRQYILADNTSVLGNRSSNLTSATVLFFDAAESGSHLYFYGPNLAQPTAMRSVNAASWNTISIDDEACTHSLSTAYTGFTLVTVGASNTITGSLTVYGLSQ